jgi:tRNA threonylcarbamoyladenosine biosynthesis protein TsaB
MIARLNWGDVLDTLEHTKLRALRLRPPDVMSAHLLAFDTATEAMAIALQSSVGVLTFDGPGGAMASARLIPEVHTLLSRAGLQLSQLQAIAFGAGPGAFTGLRTACAVAQGLAFGAALPVLAVDSLLIVAEAARAEAEAQQGIGGVVDVQVAMDARMGEVYAGAYRWSNDRWQCLSAPALYPLAALNTLWQTQPPRCVAGSALAAFGDALRVGDAHTVSQAPQRAAALMRVAQGLWNDGAAIDAAAALPLYLRDKVAFTVAERQAVARSKADA